MTSAETTIPETTVAKYATAFQNLDVLKTDPMAEDWLETPCGIDAEPAG